MKLSKERLAPRPESSEDQLGLERSMQSKIRDGSMEGKLYFCKPYF